MTYRLALLFSLLMLISSCADYDLSNSGNIPRDLLDSSVQLFDGIVVENSSIIIDGAELWKVKIENSAGAALTFYWQKQYQILFRIVGDQGPFNYELKPPVNVLVYSTAKFLAFDGFSNETLESWRLLRDGDKNRNWVYQFYLQGRNDPISINAINGELIQSYSGSI